MVQSRCIALISRVNGMNLKKGDRNEETNDLWNRIAEEGYVNTLDILSDGRNVLHTFNSGDRHYVLIVNTDTYTSRLYYLTEKEHEKPRRRRCLP